MREPWNRLPCVLAAIAGLSMIACGDDDDSNGGGGSGGGGNRRDSGTDGRRDGGFDGDVEGSEGWPCSDDECIDGLRCNASPLTIQGMPIGVCGAPCEDSSECNGGRCISYSGETGDAHCVDVVEEEYAICGVAETSVCSDDLTCLYLPNLPVGVCVRLCALDGGAAADEDAGAGVGECSGQQTCIDGVLADPPPNQGVCGTLVDRGDECGIDFGRFCRDGDVCAPEDPRDDGSPTRCFQDCSTADAECDEGTCTLVETLFAYCRPD